MFKDKNEIQRDERTVTVENSSFSLGYKFVCFALLFDVAYRAFKNGEPSWDLMAIVILSGVLTTAYQARNKILNRALARNFILTMIIASIAAILVVIVLTIR